MDPHSTPLKLMKQLGASGTQITGGYITNEEYHARLRGLQGVRQYDIMRKSEEAIRAGLQAIKLPILGQQFGIEPASDDPIDVERAEYLEEQILKNRRVKFKKFIREGLTCLDFGHSLAEKTYMPVEWNGKPHIGIESLGFRKQTSLEKWEMEDGSDGITQRIITPKKGQSSLVSIPRNKFILFVHDQEGENYEGTSILRYAFKSWDMADKLGLIQVIGAEKVAIPTPMVSVPGMKVNDPLVDKVLEYLKQYRSNQSGVIVKPLDWDIEAFTMQGQNIKDILPMLQHYEQKMLLSMLSQFLMQGMGDTGARATSQDHRKMFLMAEEYLSDYMLEVIQTELVEQLYDLNYSDHKNGYPKIKGSPILEEDVSVLADALGKLKTSGLLTSTYETEKHVRKVMRLPEVSTEDYEESKAAPQAVPVASDDDDTDIDVDELKNKKTKDVEASKRRARQKVDADQKRLIDIILRD